jgi:hypothetical protein
MTTLASLARLIRSKNAGPFVLTFDIMFEDEERYRRVCDSGVMTCERIAGLYNLPEQKVRLFFCDGALAIKASIPRPITQGDLGDADGHGGQQYAPLMDIEVP